MIDQIPLALRDDLLTYLFCTSPDRARVIADLFLRDPGIGDLLADLEADDDPRHGWRSSCWRGRPRTSSLSFRRPLLGIQAFPQAAPRSRNPSWQPRGPGFESPWVHRHSPRARRISTA